MVSTDLLAIESWDFLEKTKEKNTGLDDIVQNKLLEDYPEVVKWAKNVAKTVLPLDGRQTQKYIFFWDLWVFKVL